MKVDCMDHWMPISRIPNSWRSPLPIPGSVHPGRFTWNLKTTSGCRGTSSSKGPFPGSMSIFQGGVAFIPASWTLVGGRHSVHWAPAHSRHVAQVSTANKEIKAEDTQRQRQEIETETKATGVMARLLSCGFRREPEATTCVTDWKSMATLTTPPKKQPYMTVMAVFLFMSGCFSKICQNVLD